jgi:hypothetical protein
MYVNIENMKTGFARIHTVEGGAISVYVDKEVGKLVTLPSKTRLKAIWNEETEQLIIQKWTE